LSYRITYKKSVFKDLSRIEKNETRKIVSTWRGVKRKCRTLPYIQRAISWFAKISSRWL